MKIYRLVLNIDPKSLDTEMSLSLLSPSSSLVMCARSALPGMPPRLALPLPGRPPRLALASRKLVGLDSGRSTKVGMQKTPVGCQKVELNLLSMADLATLGDENLNERGA